MTQVRIWIFFSIFFLPGCVCRGAWETPRAGKDFGNQKEKHSPLGFFSLPLSCSPFYLPPSSLTKNPTGLVSAVVLYLGCAAAGGGASSSSSPSSGPGAPPAPPPPPNSPVASRATELLTEMASAADPEGRYALLNACANQLRYPNSHTHYFSCLVLSLFGDGRAPGLQEAVTRVLLERLVVNRPHPWGLLVTFIELIKNPRYAFWGHPFTRCAAEVERLFESVARSCMGPPPPLGGGGGGGGGAAAAGGAGAAATAVGGGPGQGAAPGGGGEEGVAA